MEWRKGKLIGRGSSADVSLGRDCLTGDVFAVKHTPLSRSSDLRKEEEIHSSLKCAQIIEYKGNDVTLENGHFFYNILLEYASRGTVIDMLRSKGGGLSEPIVRGYTREIVKGLEYLHSRGIVHCDIKGANILVTNEGVKIGDFGCSKRVGDVAVFHSLTKEIAGTPMYMAPEVARGEEQSYPADVWALGCTVLEMATGLPPWSNITQDPISALYWIGFTSALPDIPGYLSDQAKDFLDKCLKRDTKERWSMPQLLNHPFLSNDGLIHEPSDTPTSVLDPSLWENMEKSDSSLKILTHEGKLKSPNERIRELAGDASLEMNFNLVDDDDAWITVRSKNNNETEKAFSRSGRSLTQTIDIHDLPKPEVKTIVECFTCECMQVYSSSCFSVSKIYFKHLYEYIRIICVLGIRSNAMTANILNFPAKKVCNKLFFASKFTSNFRICAGLQKFCDGLSQCGVQFCGSLVYRNS